MRKRWQYGLWAKKTGQSTGQTSITDGTKVVSSYTFETRVKMSTQYLPVALVLSTLFLRCPEFYTACFSVISRRAEGLVESCSAWDIWLPWHPSPLLEIGGNLTLLPTVLLVSQFADTADLDKVLSLKWVQLKLGKQTSSNNPLFEHNELLVVVMEGWMLLLCVLLSFW